MKRVSTYCRLRKNDCLHESPTVILAFTVVIAYRKQSSLTSVRHLFVYEFDAGDRTLFDVLLLDSELLNTRSSLSSDASVSRPEIFHLHLW